MKNADQAHFQSGPSESAPHLRACDRPECRAEGLYRAPRSREEQDACYWFCLGHVRDYNRAWNYFDGMSDADLERYVQEDVTGHRPTWKFGVGRPFSRFTSADDIFSLFADGWPSKRGARRARRGPMVARSPREKALAIMGLDSPMELDSPVAPDRIKSRYKELAKRHHPDANGGNKDSEERLKLINRAYSFLMVGGDF